MIRARAAGGLLALWLASTATVVGCSQGGPDTSAIGDADHGREVLATSGCAGCHRIPGIRGTRADVAPPLHGLADRGVIAGGLPNEPQHLVAWILDPVAIDPSTAMPDLGLTPEEARDVVAYLLSR